MINNVSFCGKEGLLIGRVDKVAQEVVDVVKASSILPSLSVEKIAAKPVIKEAIYTNPYAPTEGKILNTIA